MSRADVFPYYWVTVYRHVLRDYCSLSHIAGLVAEKCNAPLNTDMRILDHVSRRKICYAQHLQVQMTLQQHLSRAHENLIQEISSLTSDTDSLPLRM